MDELLSTIKADLAKHSKKLGGLSTNDKRAIFNYHTLHLTGYNQTEEDEETLWRLRQKLRLT